jgi:enoyl-CoA hydratase/carnithine racemase
MAGTYACIGELVDELTVRGAMVTVSSTIGRPDRCRHVGHRSTTASVGVRPPDRCHDAGMDDVTTSAVRVEVDGRVARLTLDRPDRLNALDDGVRLAIRSLLDDLEERPEVSVLVLAGAGRAFSAGADLRATSYPPPTDDADWVTRRHQTGTWQRLLDQLGRIPQVTVAGLHGHVIGGAALLAAACVLRIGADDTQLRIPELAMGIPLTWAGVPLLVREVGLPVARDWIMTCRPVPADELLRTGFVTRLVPAGSLDEAVEACVQELLVVPPGPLAMTRAMTAAIGRTTSAMATGWADADHQRWAFTEDEYRQAVRSYIEAKQARAGERRG